MTPKKDRKIIINYHKHLLSFKIKKNEMTMRFIL